jgi:vacuolar protein sorting-associated protein 35
MNAELFIETLVRYIFFYEKGCTLVTPKYINGLLELIATNLRNLKEAENENQLTMNGVDMNKGIVQRGFSVNSLVGLDVSGERSEGSIAGFNGLLAISKHFERTCAMLRDRKVNPPKTLGETEGPFYTEINLNFLE